MSSGFTDKGLWGLLFLAGSQNLPISILFCICPIYKRVVSGEEERRLRVNTS